jgi:hypothetical protein
MPRKTKHGGTIPSADQTEANNTHALWSVSIDPGFGEQLQ